MRRVSPKPVIRLLAVALWLLALAVASTPAMAARAPGWEVESHSYPTNLAPGSAGDVALDVENIGATETNEEEATLTDVLPAGVEGISEEGWTCTTATPPSSETCVRSIAQFYPGLRTELLLKVKISPNASEASVTNTATVSGGGAASVSNSDQLHISSLPAKFGFAHGDAWFSSEDGLFDTQAGSHPFAFTFSFDLNSDADATPVEGEARNITFKLPRGVIGDPTAVAQCTREEFDEEACSTGSQIGIDYAGLGHALPPLLFAFAVYNIVPPPGHPAEFGFDIFGIRVILIASVRSGGDYGITENVDNLPQRIVETNSITIWGDAADSSHDHERTCRYEGRTSEGNCPSSADNVPFLTTPTACEGPQSYSAKVNDWLDESITSEINFPTRNEEGQPQGFEGCEQLDFTPTLNVAPETTDADTPTGLSVELKVPQEGLTAHEIGQGGTLEDQFRHPLVSANIKDTTVTLPEGLVINPGQAAGLSACQSNEDGVGTEGPPSCASSSEVGTDEIDTPLLAHPLKGEVYVLQSNPPNIKLLVAAAGEGVDLKLVGEVHLDETTGRLTTTFKETPELPFTTFRLTFSGGARAALATPVRCGLYATSSDFTPWSTPFSSDVSPSSEFVIGSGPGGVSCAAPVFAPTLTAGSTTDQAGGFTGFSLLLTRPDGQQHIEKLQFEAPRGLVGMLSKVPLCEEPQAAAGTCSAASQIGHTTVEAGPGSAPLVIPEPGQPPAPIYLTAGYKGAPYGLSIAVPVLAGPFNLGTVVVRASIAVDPHTAQLTITTDALPSILDGVPTDLRVINAVIDKPGFMINPTNCEAQSFSGTATSTEGTTAAISSQFGMGSCRSLEFKPKLTVSIPGHASKALGEGLTTTLSYPNVAQGTDANIAKVKVDLPVQLPSQLKTLQKACVAAVFEANPANCPADSIVGHATVHTPLLPVSLKGPAYFVSHAGAEFPSLTLVLQGYGVTVDLVGSTFISKAGITSTTFNSAPDVPFSSFELVLPQGKYAALGVNLPAKDGYDYCGQTLSMPTAFVGQNGAEVHTSTPISVEGCSNALAIRSHAVNKNTVTLSVYVPAAGKLKASAPGLTSTTKTSKGQQLLTLTLTQRHAGKLVTKIHLAYTPSEGHKQTKTLTTKFTK
jgi:hypothetical protein